jgi:CRP-like cAMP-binding protein
MVDVETLHRNKLLEAVPRSALEAIGEAMRATPLSQKQRLYEAGETIAHVCFPLDAVVSLLVAPDGDDPIEVATVGNEGMVGVNVFLGTRISEERAITQIAGTAVLIDAPAFLACSRQNEEFAGTFYRYTSALLAAASLTAACNRVHTLPQRCARWLLLTHDRVGLDAFPLTQEFLAQMLGARRPTISVVASNLQEEGFIRYARGVITIVDRSGLEEVSCSCYQLQRDSYKRLMGL